jgi:hypothetical protein
MRVAWVPGEEDGVSDSVRTITHQQWLAEGESLFGKDAKTWRFVCPSCGHVASLKDWKDAGAGEGHMAFSCVGRFLAKTEPERKALDERTFKREGGPCMYAGAGLFAINPVIVKLPGGGERRAFEFARPAP